MAIRPVMSANMNSNLKMNRYSDFFNGMDEEKIDAYKNVRGMIDELKGTEADVSLKDFYFKSFNAGVMDYNIPALEQGMNMFNDMLDAGAGSVYAMDLETLGNPFGDASEKGLFAITEMTLTKKDLATGTVLDVQNVLFGLTEEQRLAYENLIARAELGYNSLTSSEKSTIERLARYGAKDTKIINRGGKAILANLGIANPMDLTAAKKGLNRLVDIGPGQAWGSQFARDQLIIASNHLNQIKGPNNILFTHNGSKFDMPAFNEALRMHGISNTINDINHVDFQAAIRTAYGGDTLNLHLTARETNGVKGKIKGALETLDKLAESFGIRTHAHVASNDNRTLINLLTAPYRKTEHGTINLGQDLKSRLNAYSVLSKHQDIDPSTVADKVIFVKNAVYTNGLDYIKTSEGIKPYGDWPLQRNNFYRIENVGKVNIKDTASLRKIGINVPVGSTGSDLYYMTLRNVATGKEEETINIVRSSREELQALFQKNLEVFRYTKDLKDISSDLDAKMALQNQIVSQAMIDETTRLATRDNARRKFEGMFQTSGKGFNYAKGMYQTYNNLYQNGITTAEEAALYIQNNPTSELLRGLQYKGDIIPERRSDFLEMFNLIRDTSDTMTTVINRIESNIPVKGEAGTVKRTVALGRAYENLQNAIMQASGVAENIAKNRKLITPYPMDIDVINIGVDDIHRITVRARSVEEARINILNGIDKLVGTEKNKRARENKRMFYLRRLAENVYGKDSEKLERMFGQLDSAYYTAGEIAGDLNKQFLDGTLNIGRDEIYATDLDSYVINSSTFDQFMVDNNINVLGLTDAASAHIGSLTEASLGDTVVMEKGVFTIKDENLRKLLMEDYHYSADNVHDLMRGLYGKSPDGTEYGLVNKHGLVAELFVDEEGYLSIALTDKKHATELYESLAKNEVPKNAAISRLPQVSYYGDDTDLLKKVSFGSVEKQVTTELNTYYSPGSSGSYYNNIRIAARDTTSESLNSLVKLHRVLPDLIEAGEYDRASRQLTNTMAAPIFGGSGFSGNTTVAIDDILAEKALRPNVSDIITASTVDMTGLVNFIPELYKRDEEIRNDLNRILVNNKAIDDRFIDNWIRDIQAGNLKQFSDMDIELREWYTMNMFEGHKILHKIRDLKAEGGRLFQKEVSLLDSLIANGASFFNKAEKVSEGLAVSENPFEYVTYGFMNELSRPVARQSLAFHALDPRELAGASVKLEAAGMKLGQTVVTDKMYNKYLKKYGFETGITGDIKNLNDTEILDAIESLDKEELYKKYGKSRVDKIINEYKTIGSTFQQHSLINPMLTADIYNKPELIKFDVTGNSFEFAEGLGVGKEIKSGSLLGYEIDGETRRAVVYNGQDGIISGFINRKNAQKVVIKPFNAQIDEIKLIMGGVEKSVASVVNRDAEMLPIAQEIWDKLFGKSTAVVGRFEIGKHEAASIAYGSTITRMAERALEHGEAVQNEFANLLNQNLPEWNGRWEGNKFVISGNPNAAGGHFSGIRNLVDAMRDKGIYDDIIADFDNPNTNTLRTLISKGQMSEMFSVMEDEADIYGKGLKITDRELQIAGIRSGEQPTDFFFQDANGKWQKKLQPVIDAWREEITRENIELENGKLLETNYSKAKKDLRNITNTYSALRGETPTAAIKELHFDDVKPILKGVDAATLEDALKGTVFEDVADVFKITLPNNMKVLNMVTGEMDDHIYIPYLHSYDIDGKVITHNAHRKSADLLRMLDSIAEGKLPNGVRSMSQLQSALNDAYAEAMAAYGRELSDDKNSILKRHLVSGRLSHSGQGLAGAVVSPELFKNGEVDSRLAGIVHSDVVEKVGDKILYKDVAYTSAEMLEDMGVDFAEIGRQVLEDKKIRSQIGDVDAFIARSGFNRYDLTKAPIDIDMLHEIIKQKILKDNNPYTIDDAREALENLTQLGKYYAREKGIMSIMLRYPSFLQTSLGVTNIRLSPYMHGRKFNIMSWTAAGLNADIDADRLSVWLNLTKTGGLQADTEVKQKALIDVFNAQARNNAKLFEKALEDYADVEPDGLKAYSAKGFDEFLIKKTSKKLGYTGTDQEIFDQFDARSNKLMDPERRMTAVKANFDKAGIGYISNTNVTVRDIAFEQFRDSGDIYTLSNILEFTDKTEQKLIDVKHMKTMGDGGGNIDDIIIKAGRYRTAINTLATGDARQKDEAINKLREILFNSDVYKREQSVRVDEVLGSLRQLFDSKYAKQWTNPIRSKMSGKNYAEQIKDVNNFLKNPTAYGGTELTNLSVNEVIHANDIDTISIDDTALVPPSKGTGYPVLLKDSAGKTSPPIGAYVYSGSGVGANTNMKYVELEEFITDPSVNKARSKRYRIYGNTMADIQRQMRDEFRVATDINDVQNLIDVEKGRILDSAMSSGFEFEKERITAEFLNGGSIDDILAKSTIGVENRQDIIDHLTNLNPTQYQSEAYRQLASEFFDNEMTGRPMRRFSAAVSELAERNYIGNQASLIQAFNNYIRQRGAEGPSDKWNPAMISDVHDELIRKALYQVPGLPSAQIEGILNQVNTVADDMIARKGEIRLRPAKVQNVAETIARIQDTPLYDMKSAFSQLENMANDMLGNITKTQLESFAEATRLSPEDAIAKLRHTVKNENIQLPFKAITQAESVKIASLNQMYSELLASKNQEAMDFLGWKPINEVVNAYNPSAAARAVGETYDPIAAIREIGQSKVTYGRYAGMEFSSLSIGELKEIMNLRPETAKTRIEADNIVALKQRVNQYFSLLDQNTSAVRAEGISINIPEAVRKSRYVDVDINELLKSNGIELKNLDDLLDTTKRDLKFDMARGTIKEGAENAVKRSEDLLGSSKFGKIALAGLALGLAGYIVGQMSAKPGPLQPEHRPSGEGAPAPDGTYEPKVNYKTPQPQMPKKAVMQENNPGMRIKISAKNGTSMSNSDVAGAVNKAIADSLPNRMNVNVVSRDDTSAVNDSWLEEQFKRLIGG